ncbi:MAG: hypothetical protein RJA63_1416 [Pseudomonadota bacterium]|jgi:hypothetical protein
MPKATPAKLKYMKEYQARPENVDKRVDRNRARRHAIASGKASVGDGTEVDHKIPLDKGGSDKDSNTRVVPAAKNRAWRKEHPGMYGKRK